MHKYLSTLQQTLADVKKLNDIAPLLVKRHIVNSTDDTVQLYVSCCLAEIIRVFAPNAPYNEVQLKHIFELFLVTLADLHKKSDVVHSNLLQQLVRVKAFLLLIDLDMHLVRKTFTQFLNIPTYV